MAGNDGYGGSNFLPAFRLKPSKTIFVFVWDLVEGGLVVINPIGVKHTASTSHSRRLE